jgi:hypothetical protein
MALAPLPTNEMLYSLPATIAEHRLKVQQADQERAALRASELATQISPANGAEERIRIWERLHELRLPRNTSHVLVNVIATQTCLSLDQVRAEQRRRATPVARPAAAPAQVVDVVDVVAPALVPQV